MDVIKNIQNANEVDAKDAQQILDDELGYCRDLLNGGDLCYDDLEDACFNMGIDLDNIEAMIEMLAY